MLTTIRLTMRHKLRNRPLRFELRYCWSFVRNEMTVSQRALYAITCQFCSPLVQGYFQYEKVKLAVGGLRTGCRFCEIIRQVLCRSVDGAQVDGVAISFERSQDAVLLKPYGNGLPEEICLQIYSRGKLTFFTTRSRTKDALAYFLCRSLAYP